MDHGRIWNESPHGGIPVSTTVLQRYWPFMSLLTSHTIWYLASGPPVCCHSFIHHCFLFAFRPYRKSGWQTTSTVGRASSCRCYATIGVGPTGVTSSKIIRCPLNKPAASGSTSTIFFCFFSSINHFIYKYLYNMALK